MKILKPIVFFLISVFFCGCSAFKNIVHPDKTVEKIYSEGIVEYSKEDDDNTVETALEQAKQNAINQIIEVFITPDIIKRRQNELDKHLFSQSDDFIKDYKIIKENYLDYNYKLKIKAYVMVENIIEKLAELKLIGKKSPKKVVIYPHISSQIRFSNLALLNPITAKLSENLYSTSMFNTSSVRMIDTETVLTKAREIMADYVMIINANVYKISEGTQFISGFYPYKTNLDFKIYSVERSSSLAHIIKQGSGFGTSPKISAETSVQKAVKLVLDEVPFPFEKAKSSATPVTLEVKSLSPFEKLKKFYATLLDLTLVTDFSLSDYKKGGDVTFLVYGENAGGQEIAALLLRKNPFRFTVEEISPHKIRLTAE